MNLHDRIIEISKKHNLSHLGSCLTSVDIIDYIYSIKKQDEKFILSSGHAGLALYVVIEKYLGIDAEKTLLHHGIHPDKCDDCKLDCSTGSLGLGLPIAVGMALADRTKDVYCLCSDGEAFEGTIWECSNIIDRFNITNLKLYFNCNYYSAYSYIDGGFYEKLINLFPNQSFSFNTMLDFKRYGINPDLSAHYCTL